MKLSLINFTKQIEKINYFEKNAKIAVGVSGGVDSITLAHLLSKTKKLDTTALIVDHKYRPESYTESRKVTNYLSKMKIKSKILTLKKQQALTAIQKNLRAARLKILEDYCKENNIIHLFLGHHYDDNIETFVLRKLAGSSIEGLNSIKEITIFNNIQILRPLLAYTKTEIINYAKTNRLFWIDDPSNKNINFSRTKIRSVIASAYNEKKIINKEYKNLNNLYLSYLRMINSYLSIIILKASHISIELDKTIFLNLPVEIATKILSISIIYLHGKNFRFKHKKLKNVYNQIKSKNMICRSQNTYFTSLAEKITISAAK